MATQDSHRARRRYIAAFGAMPRTANIMSTVTISLADEARYARRISTCVDAADTQKIFSNRQLSPYIHVRPRTHLQLACREVFVWCQACPGWSAAAMEAASCCRRRGAVDTRGRGTGTLAVAAPRKPVPVTERTEGCSHVELVAEEIAGCWAWSVALLGGKHLHSSSTSLHQHAFRDIKTAELCKVSSCLNIHAICVKRGARLSLLHIHFGLSVLPARPPHLPAALAFFLVLPPPRLKQLVMTLTPPGVVDEQSMRSPDAPGSLCCLEGP